MQSVIAKQRLKRARREYMQRKGANYNWRKRPTWWNKEKRFYH